jgi:hypothetical protein
VSGTKQNNKAMSIFMDVVKDEHNVLEIVKPAGISAEL